MKKIFVMVFLFGFTKLAMAIPTLQVYGVDGVAYDGGNDEDSWLLTGVGSQTLELIGTYGPDTVSINNAYLILTTSAHHDNLFGTGYTKYDDAAAFEATLTGIDPDLRTNNHAPYGSDSSLVDTYAYDLSLLNMDSFARIGATKDCNADVVGTTGCVAAPNSLGQIYSFGFDFTGIALDWVHFDLVALVTDDRGRRGWVSTWEINPGSHDTTWTQVPEPGSLALLGLVLLGLGIARRKAN